MAQDLFFLMTAGHESSAGLLANCLSILLCRPPAERAALEAALLRPAPAAGFAPASSLSTASAAAAAAVAEVQLHVEEADAVGCGAGPADGDAPEHQILTTHGSVRRKPWATYSLGPNARVVCMHSSQ